MLNGQCRNVENQMQVLAVEKIINKVGNLRITQSSDAFEA